MKIPPMGMQKHRLLLAALLVLFLASAPTGYAEAGVWDWIKGNFVGGALAVWTSIMLLIPGLIFWVVAGITGWFMDIVLSIPIIPGSNAGAAPEFVNNGWNLLRGLANMFFLLILVFIGLATILRLREYELQRTLPRLVIAALLVNFSAVFVGFVVDVANLVASYFLNNAKLNLNLFQEIWSGAFNLQQSLAKNGGGEVVDMFVGAFVYVVVMWAFYLIASLVYLAVFLILFLRTIILWVLVILSPLAFAAAVLPATRSMIWNRWLGSLLQWAFVVVPISFFLFLSKNVMTLNSQGLFQADNPQVDILVEDTTGAGLQGALAQLLGNIMGPFVGIVILLVGITVSMAMAPGSVRAVGNFTRKAATVTTGILGYKALSKLAESKKVRGAITRGSVAESRLGYKYNQATGEWEQKRSAWGAFQRRVGGVTGYTRRAAFGVAEKQIIERQEQREAQQAQKLRGRNATAYMQALRQEGSESGRAAILAQAAQEGKLRAMMDEDAMGGAENTLKAHEVEKARLYAEEKGNEDLQDAIDRGFVAKETGRRDDAGNLVQMQYARRNKDTGEVERDASGNIIYDRRNETWTDRFAQIKDRASADAFDPKDRTYGGYSERDVDNGLISREEFDLLKADVQAGSPQRLVGNRGYSSKVIAGATSAEDIRQLQRRWQENDLLMEDVHRYWKGNQANAATQQIGRRFLHRLETTRKHGDWYFEIDEATGRPRNIAMAQWEASTGAQNLGVTAKEGAGTTSDVRNKARIANNLANIQDATIRGEVKEILDEMTVLDNKREVMDVLAQDPDLRDVFQGIPKENEQARRDVAHAINQIRDTSQWRDIGDILKANPELHHVSQQLAAMPTTPVTISRGGAAITTNTRAEAVDLLSRIQNRNVRGQVAGVFQETPEVDLVEVGRTVHGLADRKRELANYESQLQRVKDIQRLKKERGEDTTVEDRRIRGWENEKKKVQKELNTLNKMYDENHRLLKATPQGRALIPQAENLERILQRTGYYFPEGDEGDGSDATGGAAPTGGGSPTGSDPSTGGTGGGRGRRRRRTPPPNRPGPRRGGGSTPPSPPPSNPPNTSGGGDTTLEQMYDEQAAQQPAGEQTPYEQGYLADAWDEEFRSVFNPEQELAKIRRLPAPQRRAATENFKRQLATQREEFMHLQERLVQSVRQNPDQSATELYQQVVGSQEQHRLSPARRNLIRGVLKQYQRRHKLVKGLREQYPDDAALFAELFGREPQGKVEIKTNPSSFYIKAWDPDDYAYAWAGGPDTILSPDEKQRALQSGGVALHDVRIPGLEHSVTVENSSVAPPGYSETVEKHEEQHSLYDLRRQFLQPEIRSRLFKEADTALQKFNKESKFADPPPVRKKQLEKVSRPLRQQAAEFAGNEILAYYKGGTPESDTMHTLAPPDRESRLYDYLKGRREYIAGTKFPSFGHREELNMPPEEWDRMVKEELSEKYKSQIKTLVEIPYELERKGYSKEQVLALLEQEPVSRWQKVADRLLKEKEKK